MMTGRICSAASSAIAAAARGSPAIPQQAQKREATGTGFIVDKNGYIVTNNHVVEAGEKIRVKMHGDSNEYRAKVIGTDRETDLAVIKIDAKQPAGAGLHRQFGSGSGGRLGGGDRLSVRPGSDRHRGYRQRHRTRQHRRPVPALHSDRRGHQSRQQRRTAAEHQRRSDRRQHHDRHARRRF